MVHVVAPKIAAVRRADLLAKLVLFLSTTESRSKVYRVVQYSAKMAKWSLAQVWGIDRSLPQQSPTQQQQQHAHSSSNRGLVHGEPELASKLNGDSNATAASGVPLSSPAELTENPQRRQVAWRKSVLAALSRVELLFGDARKVFRLLQFLEMVDMVRNVHEPERAVRVLRRLRIVCFFLFYLLENSMLLLLRVGGLAPRDPRVKVLKRGCNGFWCLSILLAFPLDHIMGRSGALSTLKKLLDLPVAYVAYSDQRVSDGLFGALGIASGNIGIYLRWVEVMRKLQPHSGATGADVA